MVKERILLVGGNYYPEPTGIGKYNGELMDWLSTNGYQCRVVTTFPYYPYWKFQEPYAKRSAIYRKEKKKLDEGNPIVIHRCLHYVPTVPCGKRRVFSDLSFFLSAFFQILSLLFRKKYDYVISVAPPFQLGLLALLYKKIKGAKFIYHNQDLQIDAANELGMIKSKRLMRLMFWLERVIIKKADYVSSISDGMIQKMKGKCDRDILLFPNWSDIGVYHPIMNTNELKTQFNISINDKVVLYSGAIGEKQGLQTLLKCANELQYRKEIKFIICGSGPYQKRLVDMAKEMKLLNVIFMPLQPKEKFNFFMNMADVHLVMQKANVNDLVMPSKLAAILSVGGLAIITSKPETNLYNLIRLNKIGILVEPENILALTASIVDAIDQPPLDIIQNARKYAEDHLDINKIISEFFACITKIEKRKFIDVSVHKSLHIDIGAN